mmetsp:Transcript_107249/g.212908  ORF Transcript_107249/g.212908 Transcript_107249/m.212908 type:complete len:94 (+) Transcript_107249:2888-3169(+)
MCPFIGAMIALHGLGSQVAADDSLPRLQKIWPLCEKRHSGAQRGVQFSPDASSWRQLPQVALDGNTSLLQGLSTQLATSTRLPWSQRVAPLRV